MAVSRSAGSTSESTINELSSIIGELRNFAAQQIVTNTHMLEELKKIGDRMGAFSEVGATFVEYRKTLHERFGKIHEQLADIDEDVERVTARVNELELLTSGWKANWKIVLAGFTALATVLSAAISTYGLSLLKAIVH